MCDLSSNVEQVLITSDMVTWEISVVFELHSQLKTNIDLVSCFIRNINIYSEIQFEQPRLRHLSEDEQQSKGPFNPLLLL